MSNKWNRIWYRRGKKIPDVKGNQENTIKKTGVLWKGETGVPFSWWYVCSGHWLNDALSEPNQARRADEKGDGRAEKPFSRTAWEVSVQCDKDVWVSSGSSGNNRKLKLRNHVINSPKKAVLSMQGDPGIKRLEPNFGFPNQVPMWMGCPEHPPPIK